MTENATYCDKHVSSWKCIFCSDMDVKERLWWTNMKREIAEDIALC